MGTCCDYFLARPKNFNYQILTLLEGLDLIVKIIFFPADFIIVSSNLFVRILKLKYKMDMILTRMLFLSLW